MPPFSFLPIADVYAFITMSKLYDRILSERSVFIMRTITKELILTFKKHLITEEKAQATIAKYLYDIGEFAKWTGTRDIPKYVSLFRLCL